MGKIYDDWGRLVKAVIQRERLLEIAMCSSREPSSIDDESSRFSIDTSLLSEQSVHDLETEIASSSIDGGSARYSFSSISSFYEQALDAENASPIQILDETCPGASTSSGHKYRTKSEHDANKFPNFQKMFKPEFGHNGLEFQIDSLVVERKLQRSKPGINDLQQVNNELHASHKRIEKELERIKLENCILKQNNDELCASIFARKIEIHYLHTSNEVMEKELERIKSENLELSDWKRDYEKQLDLRQSEILGLQKTITELRKMNEDTAKTKRFVNQQEKRKPEKEVERSERGKFKLQARNEEWEIFYLNKKNYYKQLDEKKSEIHNLQTTIMKLRKLNEVAWTKTKSFDAQQEKRMLEIHHLHRTNNAMHKWNKVIQEERERYKTTLCVVMFIVLVTFAKLIS